MDLPTRDGCEEAANLVGGKVVDHSREAGLLASELIKTTELPWDLLSAYFKARLPSFKS